MQQFLWEVLTSLRFEREIWYVAGGYKGIITDISSPLFYWSPPASEKSSFSICFVEPKTFDNKIAVCLIWIECALGCWQNSNVQSAHMLLGLVQSQRITNILRNVFFLLIPQHWQIQSKLYWSGSLNTASPIVNICSSALNLQCFLVIFDSYPRSCWLQLFGCSQPASSLSIKQSVMVWETHSNLSSFRQSSPDELSPPRNRNWKRKKTQGLKYTQI